MNKNTRINEILGAKKFQKVVFVVEKVKYKLFDKLFPNLQQDYEKRLDKALDKALKEEPDEEKRRLLLKNYHDKVLASRQESNNKSNRNYHFNKDNPMEFIKYLNSNKKIHINGLIGNGVTYLIAIPLLATGVISPLVGGIVLGVNTIHTFINFECVNLQNYNLKRFEKSRKQFEELRIRKQERDLEAYKNVTSVVSSKINSQREIPEVEEVVEGITTKEELEEMRKLLLSYMPNNSKEKGKVLRKGEKVCQQ